jgi:uncharacterized protein YbjT (DUF2867 family)
MRVFVTGASGHIGSAVIAELTQAGHQVTGLASAAADADADAVIHLAFDHAAAFSGIGMKRSGDGRNDAAISANPRSPVTRAIDGFTERGVRTILVAIPPVTHSSPDRHGFIPMMIQIAHTHPSR